MQYTRDKKKENKKILKSMQHFKLSAYNKVQATRKTDKSILVYSSN